MKMVVTLASVKNNMTPEELLKVYNCKDTIVDVSALARKLKFEVTICAADIKDFGYILINKKDDVRALMLNKGQSKELYRFIIAYLIAAYIENGNDIKYAIRANHEEFFKEENRKLIDYAIEILLPDKLLGDKNIELENLKYEDLKSLKEEFCVPTEVVYKKIKNKGDR